MFGMEEQLSWLPANHLILRILKLSTFPHGPTLFALILLPTSRRTYHNKVEGKYAELGIAARYVSSLAREVMEQIRTIETRAKMASSQHVNLKGEYVNLKEVLREYLEVFNDEDSLWETLDLAHDPNDRVEFTRRQILTPKVLRSGLHSFRKRVVALTAERDAFRARRAVDIRHFEESIEELKQKQMQRVAELQDAMMHAERDAIERLRVATTRGEQLALQLGAQRARADKAQAQLRREVQGREEDTARAAERQDMLEGEVERLHQALESMCRGAHLSDIAHANAHVARQMRHSAFQ